MTWTAAPERRAQDGPYRFERRQGDRWSLAGVATAFELAGERFGRTHTLRRCDYSGGGLGGVSDTAIAPGTSVSLGFETRGYPARHGVVARCMPCGEGYRVAICFELRRAA